MTQTGGTLNSTNIIVSNLRTTSLKDSANNSGVGSTSVIPSSNQLTGQSANTLVSAGTSVVRSIPRGGVINIQMVFTTLIGTPYIITPPFGTSRVELYICGRGGNMGNSANNKNGNINMGGGGSAGSALYIPIIPTGANTKFVVINDSSIGKAGASFGYYNQSAITGANYGALINGNICFVGNGTNGQNATASAGSSGGIQNITSNYPNFYTSFLHGGYQGENGAVNVPIATNNTVYGGGNGCFAWNQDYQYISIGQGF